MAERSDALMLQAVFALAQGAAGAHISREACAWLHNRYHGWIETVKVTEGNCPADVWDEEKNGFLSKFKEIGSRALTASGGGEIQPAHLEESSKAVEAASKCPYCP